jgi:hypothetical protein
MVTARKILVLNYLFAGILQSKIYVTNWAAGGKVTRQEQFTTCIL